MMRPLGITNRRVRQPDFEARIGPLAEGCLTVRRYSTSVDSRRKSYSNEQTL